MFLTKNQAQVGSIEKKEVEAEAQTLILTVEIKKNY